jgi:hypothetical protein
MYLPIATTGAIFADGVIRWMTNVMRKRAGCNEAQSAPAWRIFLDDLRQMSPVQKMQRIVRPRMTFMSPSCSAPRR